MSCVIGIDLGTQSTKVLVYDVDARAVAALAQAPHDLHVDDDGSREQEASWWTQALRECFAQIDPEIKRRVVALAVSGQQHGFVPVDASGAVLYRVKLWNDTSTLAECAALTTALGGEAAVVRLAGNPILPGYTAPKILWLQRHHPALYRRLHTILLPHDYLNFYLTGARATECGDASGTGYFDVRRREWSSAILKAMDPERDLRSCLPAITAPDRAVGKLQPDIAAILGLPPTVLVGAGGGDNMMGAIGTGTVAPGVLTISLGTSGTLYAYSEQPVVAKANEFAAFCASSGGYLPLLCTMNCTSATATMRDLLALSLEEFDANLRQSPAGAHGIVALPYFDGERTPNVPKGKGCIFGITSANATRPNLLRAVTEATVLGMRSGLNAMRAAGLATSEVRLIGGGAKSQVWSQMVADILDLEVRQPAHSEAAAFGAAMQALWCWRREHGGKEGLTTLLDQHLRFDATQARSPQPASAAAYDRLYEHYLRHVDVVKNLYA